MNQENPNAAKIKSIMEGLSTERRTYVEDLMKSTLEILKKQNAKSGNEYNFEITERFDKEEPHQFLWISFVAILVPHPFISLKENSMGLFIKVIDMELYEKSEVNDWLDHISRIEKNNIHLEQEGITQAKFDSNSETNRTINSLEESMNQEMYDEEDIIEQQWVFSSLFTSVNPDKKTNEQYIKIFHKYMVNFSNRIMDTHIKMDEGNLPLSYDYIHNGLTMLISDFEMCDFTKFNKSELETLGFINWRNKIMMIPLWAFPIILKNNDSLKLMDIHNQEFILGKEYIDTENKNGSMSVGFPFTITKKNGLDSENATDTFELILDYDK